MAEERMIDSDKDKDRKYRFRINEDGEEELIVEDRGDSEEETAFEIPEALEDDEEAAVMTPEQLAEKMRRAEEEKAERDKKVAELLDFGERDCEAEKYSTALEYALAAEALDPECGRIYCLKLKIYTKNFTDDSRIEVAAESSAEGIAAYADEGERRALLTVAEEGLKSRIAQLSAEVEELSAENESKKADRAERFRQARSRKLVLFGWVAAVFIALLATAIYLSTIMFSDKGGYYLVLTSVFGGLTVACFFALAFCARALNIASRRVRLNKRNSSTALGRKLEEEKARLNAFVAVYDALNGTSPQK